MFSYREITLGYLFNGVSTLDGCLMPNPVYIYIMILSELFVGNIIFER